MERGPKQFPGNEQVFEQREEEPRSREMVVDLVRHGESEYTHIPPDLTERGKQQVHNFAEQLVNDIDPDRDLVVIWHSPTPRAEGSAEIIHQDLEREGRPVTKQKAVRTMRMMDVKDPERMQELFDEMVRQGVTEDQLLEHEVFKDPESKTVEGTEQLKKRTGRLLNGLRYAFEHIDPGQRRLRIIGVSHFEILNPLVQNIFGLGPKDGIQKGEGARLVFTHPQAEPDQTQVMIHFRDKIAGPLRIDPKSRELVPIDQDK